jgi:hypothetical protein
MGGRVIGFEGSINIPVAVVPSELSSFLEDIDSIAILAISRSGIREHHFSLSFSTVIVLYGFSFTQIKKANKERH